MARKDIPPAPDDRGFRERQLTPAEVRRGVGHITREIGDALRTRVIREKAVNRCIYLGARDGRQALYPTHNHTWSNNRAVAEKIAKACRSQGYEARVIEPKKYDQGWSEISFEILVPSSMQLRMS